MFSLGCWSQSAGGKTRKHLTVEEKKLICEYHLENPHLSEREITKHFQMVFKKNFSYMTTNRTLKRINEFLDLSENVEKKKIKNILQIIG